MNGSLLDALQQLAREKDVPVERLVEQLQKALAAGYRKHVGKVQEVAVEFDSAAPLGFQIFAEKVAVEVVTDPDFEVSLEEAREIDPETEVNDVMELDVTPDDFGRIAAQTVKQIMTQGVREVEKDIIVQAYAGRVGEIILASVQRVERGMYILTLDSKGEGILPRSEQISGEELRFGDRLEVYILRVEAEGRSPQIVCSRTHPNLLRRLFEREVPEIHEGVVEIMSLAREPGIRSKVAVASVDPNVDPVGACVGHRGSRVQAVTNELGREKIDIIRYHEDKKQYIAEALSPAKIAKVIMTDDGQAATVVVPDDQQSLAIGRAGQNVRLAARLTGLKLDIRSETQLAIEGDPNAAGATGPAEAGQVAGEEE